MSNRVITEDGFKLELAVVPLSFTKAHEETIDELVLKVAYSMLNEGIQIDPVIVDGRTGVVLDGMHRRAAARELGLDKLLVCKVDYGSSAILLKRWVRVSPFSAPLLEDLKVNLGLVKTEGLENAMQSVDKYGSTVSLLTPGRAYILPERPLSSFSAFYSVKTFDELCRFHKIVPWPAKDEEAIEQVMSGRFVLYVPQPTKEEVVEAALHGPMFPSKYTRHVIPVRPVGVGLPLRWLQRGVSLSTANEQLEKHLEGLEVKKLPPKSVYMGRVYDEVLYVFGGRR